MPHAFGCATLNKVFLLQVGDMNEWQLIIALTNMWYIRVEIKLFGGGGGGGEMGEEQAKGQRLQVAVICEHFMGYH